MKNGIITYGNRQRTSRISLQESAFSSNHRMHDAYRCSLTVNSRPGECRALFRLALHFPAAKALLTTSRRKDGSTPH